MGLYLKRLHTHTCIERRSVIFSLFFIDWVGTQVCMYRYLTSFQRFHATARVFLLSVCFWHSLNASYSYYVSNLCEVCFIHLHLVLFVNYQNTTNYLFISLISPFIILLFIDHCSSNYYSYLAFMLCYYQSGSNVWRI